MLQEKDPVVVLRRGKVAGIYFPYPTDTLPVEFKRELFSVLTGRIAERLKAAGIREADLWAALAVMPIVVYGKEFYRECLPETERRIAERDPADVDLLALALKLDAPI
ncbi:MAG: PIN domain-containing protein [Candidatus Bipolaricaulota bacterium]